MLRNKNKSGKNKCNKNEDTSYGSWRHGLKSLLNTYLMSLQIGSHIASKLL